MKDDRELRRLFTRLGDEEGPRGRSCPPTSELTAYAEGSLGEAARERLESHLGDCGSCLGQVRFALRSGELGPQPAVPLRLIEAMSGSRGGRRARRPVLAWLAAAAGVVLVVAAVRFAAFELPPGAPGPGASELEGAGREVRGSDGSPSAAAAPVIVEPRAGQSVVRAALAVAWEPVPDALGYAVQLLDSRGDPLWEHRTEAASTTVPPEVELAPGHEYYAWVTAQLRSGLRVRSPAVQFRVVSE